MAFTSGNPPVGSGLDEADDPDSGRANNHGFEGLAISTVCCLLVMLLFQSCVSIASSPCMVLGLRDEVGVLQNTLKNVVCSIPI